MARGDIPKRESKKLKKRKSDKQQASPVESVFISEDVQVIGKKRKIKD
jgi:hypothetical protein